VKKSHERVEAYGTVDELNSFLGLIVSGNIDPHYKTIIRRIQENLFTAEAWIASDPGLPPKDLPVLKEEEITLLEQEIDEMNKFLPELTHFILPGGHETIAWCHVARTVCRRAERALIRLTVPGHADDLIIRYLNRLSDYLFVLARKIGKDLGAEEVAWTGKR
jgi:cob(I)alamin adenosyltransferase